MTFQLSIEINSQQERDKLSFIGGKMRTVAWEIALQIALRNCSRGGAT